MLGFARPIQWAHSLSLGHGKLRGVRSHHSRGDIRACDDLDPTIPAAFLVPEDCSPLSVRVEQEKSRRVGETRVINSTTHSRSRSATRQTTNNGYQSFGTTLTISTLLINIRERDRRTWIHSLIDSSKTLPKVVEWNRRPPPRLLICY
jgi:hypothetical protein